MEKSALERLQEVLDRLTADEGGCPFAPLLPPDHIRMLPLPAMPPVLPKAIAPVVMSP